MDINFFKLQVLRNDFILTDLRKERSVDTSVLSDIAVKICDRHTGVGANGIIFITDTDDNKASLTSMAPDGSFYDFYVDAGLIASRYIFDTISTNRSEISILNNNNEFSLNAIDSKNFRIMAGNPVFKTEDSESLIYKNYSYRYTRITMGKTGVVFFPENRPRDFMKSMHNEIIKSESLGFCQPVFVKTLSPDIIQVIAWKNRMNTDNSLTASIASVASTLNGYESSILVKFNTSQAFIEWKQNKNEVFISAEPEYLFTGQYYYEGSF